MKIVVKQKHHFLTPEINRQKRQACANSEKTRRALPFTSGLFMLAVGLPSANSVVALIFAMNVPEHNPEPQMRKYSGYWPIRWILPLAPKEPADILG
ncbi:MAG: hypothetical protein QUS14_14640 [Pyrinomonadaceae bacterium]|nr:hypothetical protein [Pyrinomonadaceae bacterium]